MESKQVFQQARDLALQMAGPCDGVDIRVTVVALALMVDGAVEQMRAGGIPVETAESFFLDTLRVFRVAAEEA